MAVSRAMRRLLHVLELEEEQTKAALELARNDLKRMQAALAATGERDRRGRRLVTASASSNQIVNQTVDRVAGLEEMHAAGRHRAALRPRIALSERIAAECREQFLAKRIERRQAETLIQETEAADALEAGRRGQKNLDDWFLSRMRRRGDDRDPGASRGSLSQADPENNSSGSNRT